MLYYLTINKISLFGYLLSLKSHATGSHQLPLVFHLVTKYMLILHNKNVFFPKLGPSYSRQSSAVAVYSFTLEHVEILFIYPQKETSAGFFSSKKFAN